MYLKEELLNWYRKNKRDLPWRKTSDPYKIWVSEIILQQTRVNQGIEYYRRFVNEFPTIKKLALAKIDEVLLIWKGLGYYTRARNMHETAKMIIEKYQLKFPSTYHELLKLKGVGRYTAAAISSIAFNEPFPVVDGNVIRFYSRLFNIREHYDTTQGKKIFDKTASEQLDKINPGEYNQAVMEFGALQCTPKNPACDKCIFRNTCQAFILNETESLPLKSKVIKTKTRYFNYFIFHFNDQIYFQKRNQKDIWHSLYEFPMIETMHQVNFKEIMKRKEWKIFLNEHNYKMICESEEIKHKLTHQTIFAKFYHIKLSNKIDTNKWFLTDRQGMNNLAVPRLIDQYWTDFQKKKYPELYQVSFLLE